MSRSRATCSGAYFSRASSGPSIDRAAASTDETA